MRLVVLAALTVLLLPLDMPRVHAEEIKYKGRPQPPDDDGRYKKPPADRPQPPPSKPPENRPPDRPPDKEHPEKKPPDPQQPPDSQPPTPPPPIHPGLPGNPPRQPRPCPPGAPPDFDIGYPEPEPVVVSLPMDMNSVLVRRIRLLRLEGFAGDVIVGWRTEVTFGAAFDAAFRYDIGSMAEAFTAQAVYLLIESSRLALETTLGELLAAPEDKRSITIGQLLVHTSGLGNTNAAGGDTDRDNAVGHLLSQRLLGAPGTTFSHSDDGYVVLAAAIEIASGTTYATYLRQSGVVDAAMTSTIFPGDTSWSTRGSGGILCSARDLYVWASRFATGAALIADTVMRPFAWNDGVGIGHGWFWTSDPDNPIKWASGTSNSDDNVIVVVYPSNAILVVASNRYNGDVPWSERVATSLDPLLQSWVPPSTEVQWSANR